MRALIEKTAAYAVRRVSTCLRDDNRGAAAIEFAMILPIMFLLFVGTIEFGQALAVDRRVTLTASSSGDLIARAKNGMITTTELDTELTILRQLIRPYDESALTVRVINVVAKRENGALRYIVNWSRDNYGGTPYPRNSNYPDMPANFVVEGESVIAAEATYNYTPLIFNYFIKSAFDLQDRFFLRQREGGICLRLDEAQCVNL